MQYLACAASAALPSHAARQFALAAKQLCCHGLGTKLARAAPLCYSSQVRTLFSLGAGSMRIDARRTPARRRSGPPRSATARSLSYNLFSGFPELRHKFWRRNRLNDKEEADKSKAKVPDPLESWPWNKTAVFPSSLRSPDLQLPLSIPLQRPQGANGKARGGKSDKSTTDYAFYNEPLFRTTYSERKDAKTRSYHAGLTLRCTEFDSEGNVKVKAGKFSKIKLCTEHGIQPRDLRRIDSHFANQMPGILVRPKAILVNLLHIRAIIEADKLILFDSISTANDYDHGMMVYGLQERLKTGSDKSEHLPFEFRALEAVLISVVDTLQNDEEVLLNLVQNLLVYLEESVDRTKLRELLQYSKRLSRFEQRAINIREALEELLDNDEDLADMYLTTKASRQERDIEDHEEIELLLETYLMQVEEIVNHIQSVASHVRTTEDVVNIILDSQRNSLLLLEIKLTIFTLSFSAGSFVTGMFGMNLLNTYESSSWGFTAVSGTAATLGIILGVAGLRTMRNVLRRLS